MRIEKALREVLGVNNEITLIKKSRAAPAKDMLEEEKRKRQHAQEISQLLKRVSNIHCVDHTENQTLTPLKDRVVGELVRLQESLNN